VAKNKKSFDSLVWADSKAIEKALTSKKEDFSLLEKNPNAKKPTQPNPCDHETIQSLSRLGPRLFRNQSTGPGSIELPKLFPA
jgi:hypothetical protein